LVKNAMKKLQKNYGPIVPNIRNKDLR
jgi:hypothetical protein